MAVGPRATRTGTEHDRRNGIIFEIWEPGLLMIWILFFTERDHGILRLWASADGWTPEMRLGLARVQTFKWNGTRSALP